MDVCMDALMCFFCVCMCVLTCLCTLCFFLFSLALSALAGLLSLPRWTFPMGSSAKWVISVSKGPPPRSHVLRAPISPMRVAIHACLALRAVIALALAPCHPLFVPREATAPSHLLTSSSAMLAPSNQCRTEAMSPTVGHVSLASTAPQRDFPTLKGTVTLATFACWVPLRRPRQGRRHTLPSMGLAPRVCIASQVPVLVRSPVCLVPSTPALVEHPPRAARSAQVACFAIHPAWSPPQETVLEGFIALQVSAIALPAPSRWVPLCPLVSCLLFFC